jgi:hypothetical protein
MQYQITVNEFQPDIFNFFHSAMALKAVVGPWPHLQFHNLFYTDGRTPWMNDHPVAT